MEEIEQPVVIIATTNNMVPTTVSANLSSLILALSLTDGFLALGVHEDSCVAQGDHAYDNYS